LAAAVSVVVMTRCRDRSPVCAPDHRTGRWTPG